MRFHFPSLSFLLTENRRFHHLPLTSIPRKEYHYYYFCSIFRTTKSNWHINLTVREFDRFIENASRRCWGLKFKVKSFEISIESSWGFFFNLRSILKSFPWNISSEFVSSIETNTIALFKIYAIASNLKKLCLFASISVQRHFSSVYRIWN